MKELIVIFKDEVGQIFRSRKILYMAAISALILAIVYSTKVVQLGILILFDPENELNIYSLVTYYTLYIAIPIISTLFSYDIISGAQKNLRFLASRYSRSSIILGRFFANYITLTCFILLITIGTTLFSFWKTQNMDLKHSFFGFVFLGIFLLAWMSINLIISTICHTNSKSLYMSFAVSIMLIVVSQTKFAFLSPYKFFSHFGVLESTTITPLICFFIVLVPLSVYIFWRRDL